LASAVSQALLRHPFEQRDVPQNVAGLIDNFEGEISWIATVLSNTVSGMALHASR